jgi:hypothetical protein
MLLGRGNFQGKALITVAPYDRLGSHTVLTLTYFKGEETCKEESAMMKFPIRAACISDDIFSTEKKIGLVSGHHRKE